MLNLNINIINEIEDLLKKGKKIQLEYNKKDNEIKILELNVKKYKISEKN